MIKTAQLLFLTLLAPVVFSAPLTFDFTFTNTNSGATATGQFTIDSSNVFSGDIPISDLTNFSVTVSGAGSGNGLFTGSDYNDISWSSSSPVNSFDFSQNLVGQNGFPGNGDFNLFVTVSEQGVAPDGVAPYTLLAGDDSFSDTMTLTSLQEVSSTPEPGALALTGVGVLAMLAKFRRRALGTR